MFAPEFDAVSKKLGNKFIFEKVDVDECEELCEKLKVRSVPTVLLMDGDKEVKRYSGFATEEVFERWVTFEK